MANISHKIPDVRYIANIMVGSEVIWLLEKK